MENNLPITKEGLLQLAVATWEELSNSTVGSVGGKMTSQDLNTWIVNRDLEEAGELDPSGITFLLMVKAAVDGFSKSNGITLIDLLERPEESDKKLRLLRVMKGIVNGSVITPEVEAYDKGLRAALSEYGVLTPPVEELLKDSEALAYVRRDAFRAMKELKVAQFVEGKAEEGGAKYNPFLFESRNVNSVLEALCAPEASGITLVLVRDPEIAEYSFFVFAIQNGQNVFLVHDSYNFDNPEQKNWGRNPGRDMERHVYRMRFPYQLLGVEVDSKGHLFVPRGRGTQIVKVQNEFIKLGRIGDLQPDQVVWITMMFELLDKKFWKGGHRESELSFTTEMVVNPKVLDAGIKALQVVGAKALEVAVVTKASVSTEAMEGFFEIKPTKHNKWIEDLYLEKVPEEDLVVMGEVPEDKMLLKAPPGMEFSRDKEIRVSADVKGMSLTGFGVPGKIVRDRKWYARWNLVVRLDLLAKQDYDSKREGVRDWYEKKVRGNWEVLKKAIARGEFKSMGRVYNIPFDVEGALKERNILTVELVDKLNRYGQWNVGIRLSGGYCRTGRGHFCVERTGSIATVGASFRPKNAQDLAALAGCEVEEMPVYLRNWSEQEPYVGNSILSDVDPMEWRVGNPWRKEALGVGVLMSKRTYYHWQKEALGRVVRRLGEEKDE